MESDVTNDSKRDSFTIKLTKVVETCGGCPSQWDAWDANGTYYYLRFRFGHGTVDVGEVGGQQVAAFEYGDRLLGFLELEEFADLAGLDVSEAVLS